MCTLSWLPSRHGYWLLFTRDERRTRGAAKSPAVTRIGGVRVLAPTDGDFGGTWIGANAFGVTAALLNRYDDTPIDPSAGSVSRGLLLQSLLSVPSARALLTVLAGRSLLPFKPFTIAVTDRQSTLHLLDWDGARLLTSTSAVPGLIRTSSGRDQREAERIRGDAFFRVTAGGPVTIARLRQFHRSHLPDRGPFSVCMHREEAVTQSLTEIRLSRRRVTMRYLDGPPCLDPTSRRRRLPTVR